MVASATANSCASASASCAAVPLSGRATSADRLPNDTVSGGGGTDFPPGPAACGCLEAVGAADIAPGVLKRLKWGGRIAQGRGGEEELCEDSGRAIGGSYDCQIIKPDMNKVEKAWIAAKHPSPQPRSHFHASPCWLRSRPISSLPAILLIHLTSYRRPAVCPSLPDPSISRIPRIRLPGRSNNPTQAPVSFSWDGGPRGGSAAVQSGQPCLSRFSLSV